MALPINLQKEKISKIKLEELLFPWGCTKPDIDVGIDFNVQPYFEENIRNFSEDLKVFPRRFLIQLKSTEKEDQKLSSGVAKISIDIKHLNEWKQQKDFVLLIRYFINEDTFYYIWIDEIEIKNNQKTQTIYLNNQINKENNIEVKKIFLYKVLPPSVGKFKYIPGLNKGQNSVGKINISDIYSTERLQMLINEGLLEKIEKQAKIHNTIKMLKEKLITCPADINIRYNLACCYFFLEKYDEALQELVLILNVNDLIYAKILYKLISNEIEKEENILTSIKDIKFVIYMKWFQNTPPGSKIDTIVMINGSQYVLKYNKEGVILPVQDIKKIQVTFKFHPSNVQAAVNEDKVYLLMGLINDKNEILYKYSEIIANIGRANNP